MHAVGYLPVHYCSPLECVSLSSSSLALSVVVSSCALHRVGWCSLGLCRLRFLCALCFVLVLTFPFLGAADWQNWIPRRIPGHVPSVSFPISFSYCWVCVWILGLVLSVPTICSHSVVCANTCVSLPPHPWALPFSCCVFSFSISIFFAFWFC